MQLSLEIPIQTTWKGGEKMEDFSLYFTVEIFGEKGWEVVSTFVSWWAAVSHAELYFQEYQVRVTSPVKEKS